MINQHRTRRDLSVWTALLLLTLQAHTASAQDSLTTRIFVADFESSEEGARAQELGQLLAGVIGVEAARVRGAQVERIPRPIPCDSISISPRSDVVRRTLLHGDYLISGSLIAGVQTVQIQYNIARCEGPGTRSIVLKDTASFAWSDGSAGMSAVAAYMVRILAEEMATIRISFQPFPVDETEPEFLKYSISENLLKAADSAGLRIVPYGNPAEYNLATNINVLRSGRARLTIRVERLYGPVQTFRIQEEVNTDSFFVHSSTIAHKVMARIIHEVAQRGSVRGSSSWLERSPHCSLLLADYCHSEWAPPKLGSIHHYSHTGVARSDSTGAYYYTQLFVR